MTSAPAVPPPAPACGGDVASLGKVLFTRLSTHGRLRQLHLLVLLEDCGSIARAASSRVMTMR